MFCRYIAADTSCCAHGNKAAKKSRKFSKKTRSCRRISECAQESVSSSYQPIWTVWNYWPNEYTGRKHCWENSLGLKTLRQGVDNEDACRRPLTFDGEYSDARVGSKLQFEEEVWAVGRSACDIHRMLCRIRNRTRGECVARALEG